MTGLLGLWVAYAFLWLLFQPINPAMQLAAPVLGLGSAVLVLFAFSGNRAGQGRGSGIPALLVLMATLGYPALALIAGRPLSAAEFIGVAPNPTAMLLTSVALLAAHFWTRLVLLVAPLAWLMWSALTLHTLDAPTWPVPALAVLLGLIGWFRRR